MRIRCCLVYSNPSSESDKCPFRSAPSVKSRLPAHKIYYGPKDRPCGTPAPSVTLKLTILVIIRVMYLDHLTTMFRNIYGFGCRIAVVVLASFELLLWDSEVELFIRATLNNLLMGTRYCCWYILRLELCFRENRVCYDIRIFSL